MKEKIRKYLKTKWLYDCIIYENQMDSTNMYAKRLGEENVMGELVVATSQQTAGKGRRGKEWLSPVGNCYFSMLLRPDIQPENASGITLVAALALARSIQQAFGLEAKIKWPNDVVVNGRKLCGILTESSTGEDGLKYVVIGIGINANQMEFDEEIKETATSICLQTGREVDCAQLIADVLNCFEEYYNKFLVTENLSNLLSEYNELLVNRNREVKIIGEDERIMTAIGIDETGGLIVQDINGDLKTIISGEVSVRGIYGYV